jgi:hypothetical protein
VACQDDYEIYKKKGGIQASVSSKDESICFARNVNRAVKSGNGMKYYDCIWPLYSAVTNGAAVDMNLMQQYASRVFDHKYHIYLCPSFGWLEKRIGE